MKQIEDCTLRDEKGTSVIFGGLPFGACAWMMPTA